MTIAHPLARAWLSTGGTGAQNYDEFADDAEITAIIAANPISALAIEMPHRAPDSLGRTFADSLDAAGRRLADAKRGGHYAAFDDVAVVYRITGAGRRARLRPLVHGRHRARSPPRPTSPAWSSATRTCSSRRSASGSRSPTAIGHLLSPVLLMATDKPELLHDALAAAADRSVSRRCATWIRPGVHTRSGPSRPARSRDELLALAGGGELVVADGNHRSLAAQTAGYPRFLAVVTTPASVAIQPYNRLVSSLARHTGRADGPAQRGRRGGRGDRRRRRRSRSRAE